VCWHGYLSGVRCRFVYGPADPTATQCLLLQEIQIGFGFTLLVLAHPGSPGQNPESRKTVAVVVVKLRLVVSYDLQVGNRKALPSTNCCVVAAAQC